MEFTVVKNTYFIKYLFSPYFLMPWIILGVSYAYLGKFDTPVSLQDVTTHNVEYLRTADGGRSGDALILEYYYDKATGKTIRAIASSVIYKMSNREKENLVLKIVPPSGYKSWVRIIELGNSNKIFYSRTLAELNDRNSFTIIELFVLLFVHLVFFGHFYGKTSKLNKADRNSSSGFNT